VKVFRANIPESEMAFVNGIPYYYVDETTLENYVQSYFDVSVDHLRTADWYDADKKAYAFNMSGVGFEYDPHVQRAEYDNAQKRLVLYLDDGYGELYGQPEEHTAEVTKFTIQLGDNGTFKYISNEVL